MVLPSTSLPLVLVLPVARILTHSAPLVCFLMRGEMFVPLAICDCLNTTMRSIPLHSTDSITKEPPAQASANDLPVAKAGYASSAAARSRGKKFLSYYKPYLGLFFADMACALIVSAITLLLPLCARYITKNILEGNTPHALNYIYLIGALMLALVGVHTLCTMFIDFQGHVMGARMESDMRSELFEHYQKLSFSFYDEQRTGQLMTRITNDTFALAELYHHGPEDIVITSLTVAGAFIILLKVNVALPCSSFSLCHLWLCTRCISIKR